MTSWSDAVAALSAAPLHWLKFNETVAGSLADSGTSGAGGTASGTTALTLGVTSIIPGSDGTGYTVAGGTGSYVRTPLINTSAAALGSSGVAFAFTYQATGGSDQGPLLRSSSTNHLTINFDSVTLVLGGSTRLVWSEGKDVLQDGAPHLVVVRWRDGPSTSSCSLHVDGVEVASGTDTSYAAPTSTRWYLGMEGTAGADRLIGTFDDLLHWGTYLSTADIAVLWAGWQQPAAVLDATMPPWTAAFEIDVDAIPELALDATLPAWTADVTLNVPTQLALNATLPAWTASFEIDKPPTTNLRNRANGRVRVGRGTITTLPVVAEPPPGTLVTHYYDVAIAHTVTTVDGRPTIVAQMAQRPVLRHRIVVGGRDITYFRFNPEDGPTPRPAFRLVEPFLYGAGTLSLPQVSPAFERLGHGDLTWLRKGAEVRVQSVDPETNTIVSTDYEGIITALNIDGNTLTCDLGGEVTGRASLLHKPNPIFVDTLDVGRWLNAFMGHYVRRALAAGIGYTANEFGPVTGIRARNIGDMSVLDYLNKLVTLATTEAGERATVTKNNGRWELAKKNTTQIDATVYFDDARMVANLKRDLAEEPNRIYAAGVSPANERITFTRYPGLTEADPAPYPLASAASFGIGFTNDDCDHPEDIPITMLNSRLHEAGLLQSFDINNIGLATYDAYTAAAIRRVQKGAGIAITGNMNPTTWRHCWDVDSTGYFLKALTFPAAEDPRVQPFTYNAVGAWIGRNPGFDPTVIPVDRKLDVGVGFTREQIATYAEREISDGNNWVGTLTAHTALIAGEHTPGDPITAGDILPANQIRPGMNIWAPLFDGGTLFHVSGVAIPEGNTPAPVQIVLDTRARDTLAAWEVIKKARESRTDPARQWLNDYRASKQSKDMGVWDGIGGYVKRTRLSGGSWTVIPVVAGQAGTVRKIDIDLDTNREFCVAIFGRKVGAGWLNRTVPNPLSAAGSARWEKQYIRDRLDQRVLLYSAGSDAQPCGYWPKRKGSGNPLTGKWKDTAGFGYHTFAEPVLYLAIYVANPTSIVAGKVLTQQLEFGA